MKFMDRYTNFMRRINNWLIGLLRWVWGLGFFIISLQFFFDGYFLTSLCLILTSFLILPFVRNFMHSKTNLQLPFIVRIVAIFILIFASNRNWAQERDIRDVKNAGESISGKQYPSVINQSEQDSGSSSASSLGSYSEEIEIDKQKIRDEKELLNKIMEQDRIIGPFREN